MKLTCFLISILFFGNIQASLCYDVEDVMNVSNGTAPAFITKINNNGNVVFSEYMRFGDSFLRKAFFYKYENKIVYELPSLNNKYHTYVLGINDNDVVLGYTGEEVFNPKFGRQMETHVLKWINGHPEDLYDVFGKVNAVSNQFVSMNNKSLILGFGFDRCIAADKKIGFRSSILISPNKHQKPQILSYKNLYARLVSLNENGDASGGLMYGDEAFFGIGHGGHAPKSVACIWSTKKKKIIPIGNLTNEEDKYSFATRINDKLQVVGTSEINQRDLGEKYFRHAFFWEKGVFIDLGTLEASEDSNATAINNLGEVVGVSGGLHAHSANENTQSKGFYWSSKLGMIDLNTLITNSKWKITWANDINDHGQIVAHAIKDGEIHIVILNPIKK